jgi:hypothetical protein
MSLEGFFGFRIDGILMVLGRSHELGVRGRNVKRAGVPKVFASMENSVLTALFELRTASLTCLRLTFKWGTHLTLCLHSSKLN